MVENIKHFVMPLRAEHLLDPSPIVILHDEELTAKQWQQLSYFTQIYYVRGSPLNESSYDRVNIMKAKQVVILTSSVSSKFSQSMSQRENEGGKMMEEEGELKTEEGEGTDVDNKTFRKKEEILLDA
jgi:hypothetical protein